VWLTHSYVLAEFVALATARRFPRTLVLEYLDALMDHPDIELIWIDEQAMLLTEMICKCPLTVSGHYFLAR